jgi:hypothetical protein
MDVGLPTSCSVAFKEWSGICRALHDGRQSILLRKGGIAEAGGHFTPEHDLFWLYPTSTHQQSAGLKSNTSIDATSEVSGKIVIDTLVQIADTVWIGDEKILPRLDPFHAWTAESIAKKFTYKRPGLWLFIVRAFRAAPQSIPVAPEYEGCHTWVDLSTPLPTLSLVPAISQSAFETCCDQLSHITGRPRPNRLS